MIIRLHWKYLLAFFALTEVVYELHEQAHITVGRLVCGAYGPRDFNVWSTAADCSYPALTILAQIAGPLFSFVVMYAGMWLLRSENKARASLGFSLVFAAIPFGRLTAAMQGGGDEKVVLARLLHEFMLPGSIRLLVALLVTAICLPPILAALLRLKNRWRWLYVAGFCTVPLALILALKLAWLNGLLQGGLLATPVQLGTPALILLYSAGMLVLLAVLWKWLLRLEG